LNNTHNKKDDTMKQQKEALTPDQELCKATLSEWAYGAHHLPPVKTFGQGIAVSWIGDMSTFDFDGLTRLVLIAHRDAVRISIQAGSPRAIRIIASKRKHGSDLKMWERHPSLDDLSLLALGTKQ